VVVADLHDLDGERVRPGVAEGARGALGVLLASLLVAAALPGALGQGGMPFAISYVTPQVGRNVAAARLLGRDQPLREAFVRLIG
jgi:low temperature requirement protein LtrA